MATGLPVSELLLNVILLAASVTCTPKDVLESTMVLTSVPKLPGPLTLTSTVIVHDQAVDDVGSGPGNGADQIHAVARAAPEIPDGAPANRDPSSGDDVDSVETCSQAFDVEPFKDDSVARVWNVDDDGIGPRHEHAGCPGLADDGDRLRNGHPAEATRIEAVDLAAGSGLRDGAGERLARRRAAAGIGIVADARHPGSRCLRLGT